MRSYTCRISSLLRHTRPLYAIGLIGLVLLTGCPRRYNYIRMPKMSRVKYIRNTNDIDAMKTSAKGTDMRPVRYTPPRGRAAAAAVGVSAAGVYYTKDGQKVGRDYYTSYCHVYWRLNYLRLLITKGSLPHDFAQIVADIRKELDELTSTITRDGNYTVADDAMKKYEGGLIHLAAHRDLLSSGANLTSAPWSLGKTAMQDYIDNGLFGIGAKTNESIYTIPKQYDDDEDVYNSTINANQNKPKQQLSAQEKRAIGFALAYADKYQRPPRDMMKKDWKDAIIFTNKLRDQLWMMNRTGNTDGAEQISVNPENVSLNPEEVLTNIKGYSAHATDLPLGSPTQSESMQMSLDKAESGNK